MIIKKIEKFRQKKRHRDTIVRIRFSPLGQYAVSADKSGELFFWPKGDFHRAKRFYSSESTLTDVWFSEDEKQLFVGHEEGLLLVYDIPGLKLIAEVQLETDQSASGTILSGTSKPILDYVVLAVSPKRSQNIFVALEYHDFFCLSKDFQVTNEKHIHGNIIEQTTATPDGRLIFFGDDLGYIFHYKPDEMVMIDFALHHELVNAYDAGMRPVKRDLSTGIAALAISGDGQKLASTSYTGGVQIWNIESKDPQTEDLRDFPPFAERPPQDDVRIRGICFSPDSSSVLFGNDEGKVAFWNFKKGEIEYYADCHEGVKSIAVSPFDSEYAIGCKEGSIFLFF